MFSECQFQQSQTKQMSLTLVTRGFYHSLFPYSYESLIYILSEGN